MNKKRADVYWQASDTELDYHEVVGPYVMVTPSFDMLRIQLEHAEAYADRARLLLDRGAIARLHCSPDAESFFHEALTLGSAHSDPQIVARSLIGLGEIHLLHLQLAEADAALSEAYRISEACADTAGMACVLRAMAALHYHRCEDLDALKCAHRALTLAQHAGRHDIAVDALNAIGQVLVAVADYPGAMEMLRRARSISEEMHYPPGHARALSLLGRVHHQLHDFQKAYEMRCRSLTVFREIGDRAAESMLLAEIGATMRMQGDHDAAGRCLSQALELQRVLGIRAIEAPTLIELALLDAERHCFDEALRWHDEARRILHLLDDRRGYAAALHTLGIIQMHRGDCRGAVTLLLEALDAVREIHDYAAEQEIYELLARAYEQLDMTIESLHYYKLYIHLKNDIDSQEKRRTIAELQVQAEIERAEHEKEIYRLKAARLHTEVEQKSKELTAMSLHLAQKNAFHPGLRGDDPSMPEEGEGEGRSWQPSGEGLGDDHRRFVQILSERYPALTQMELRICSFLRVNLSSKEIARLVKTSVHTVDTHRRNIRRKIGLASTANLARFLTTI